jgi:hypothetical protein
MAQALDEPNLFELAGEYTQISYSTTSITGRPQFSYTGPQGDTRAEGDEIQTLRTALGTEVTVEIVSEPDRRTVTLTLLLPEIRIARGEELAFGSVAVFTTTLTTIAGPPAGVVQTYEVLTLEGVAKLVDF